MHGDIIEGNPTLFYNALFDSFDVIETHLTSDVDYEKLHWQLEIYMKAWGSKRNPPGYYRPKNSPNILI